MHSFSICNNDEKKKEIINMSLTISLNNAISLIIGLHYLVRFACLNNAFTLTLNLRLSYGLHTFTIRIGINDVTENQCNVIVVNVHIMHSKSLETCDKLTNIYVHYVVQEVLI